MRDVQVAIGHLAWGGGRVKPGDYDLAAGNDPAQSERTSLLSRRELGDCEGATVIAVVLPGRFHVDAEPIADRVRDAVMAALGLVEENPS